MGKAYVLNEDYPIVCIGAANVNRKFYVHKEFSCRNIKSCNVNALMVAQQEILLNLGRLGETVAFLSASGQDSEWE